MLMRLLSAAPFVGGTFYMVLLRLADWPLLGAVGAVIFAAVGLALLILRRERLASPIHWGFFIFTGVAAGLVWTGPGWGAALVAGYPAVFLYGSLLLIAVVPPFLGRGYFTYYFAKKTQPEAVWATDVFVTINRHLNWFWAVLFVLGGLSGLVPGLFGLQGPVWEPIFDGALPLALILGLGAPVTKWYPEYYQRRLGVVPTGQAESTSVPAEGRPTGGAPAAKTCRELIEMMPRGFNAQAVGDLAAVYQFDITGDEEFTAHLAIADGKCDFHDGPAENPGVTVKSPADVWLAVSRGEKDGQTAFMAGEYTVTGDVTLLMKLNSLFSPAPA
ncbi:MAG: SCP2 sterol-binding domain-containing protein [Proteobacteria bacterium]|nr:SCP2 sterol-binding domain-containing protein [Pseudomonadota bacterium]MBU1740717.1 SCP2 sterol-binding domain-containing protein [Pseudomonadota bacterium]